jgi:dihydroorotate dehydrogenase
MISSNKHTISDIVVTSYLGHSGDGDILPLNLLPSYRSAVSLVRETGKTVIAKTATLYDNKGFYKPWAPWKVVKHITKDGRVIGLINAFGLSNKGVYVCACKIKDAIKAGFSVIPSYAPRFSQGLTAANIEGVEALRIYRKVLGKDFWAWELDASCPSSGESIQGSEQNFIEFIKHILFFFDGCIIVKLSPVHSVEFALKLETIGVNVIHAMNTFPHYFLYPDSSVKSPLAKYGGGGYSGEFVFEQAFAINKTLREALRIPMIMGCGISNLSHIRRYTDMLSKLSKSSLNGFENSLAICSVLRIDLPEASKILKHQNIFA